MWRMRFWPTLAVLFVVAVATALGFWQRDRAHRKLFQQQEMAQQALMPPWRVGFPEERRANPAAGAAAFVQALPREYRRVLARGRFLPEQTVYLDNRFHRDQAGFYVLTPFALSDGSVILVNRGWVPRNRHDRTAMASYATPTDVSEIEGIVRSEIPRTMSLMRGKRELSERIRQNISLAEYREETGLPLEPFVLQQSRGIADGLLRDWSPPTVNIERHYGYMLQWWAIALVALGGGLYVARRAASTRRGLEAGIADGGGSLGDTLDARRQEKASTSAVKPAKPRSRKTLYLLLLVSIAPVAASYFTYYVIKPRGGASNYGTLVNPQRPLPTDLALYDDNGRRQAPSALLGKWLLLSVDSGDCDGACRQKLFYMRQVRLTQGVERERIQTIRLQTSSTPLAPTIRGAYPDTQYYVADVDALSSWLPTEKERRIGDHIFLVDPNGNLMMRFPENPDPSLIKRDLSRLLKWSGIG